MFMAEGGGGRGVRGIIKIRGHGKKVKEKMGKGGGRGGPDPPLYPPLYGICC